MLQVAFGVPARCVGHSARLASRKSISGRRPRTARLPAPRATRSEDSMRGISSASESGDSLISTSLNASPVPASIVTDVSQPARRRLLTAGLSSVGIAALLSLDAMGINIAAASVDTTQASSTQDVTEYRGPLSLGFSFSYPSTGWSVKKKPIKTHMSEIVIANSSGRSTSSAGVTVDAVKIGKIEDFGTAEDVGKKVVAVETKKDSVLSADVLSTKVLVIDGLTYYVIEYVVESGRGRKQYVAKATITGGNLYVFTAQAKEDDLNGADGAALTTMVDSFYVKPQYL